MADAKISALTAATDIIASDLLVMVDVSDTTQAPSGTTKQLTKANLLNRGTLTADSPETVQQEWNNAAVAFTAFKVNPTNVASAANSLVADFQAGSSSKLCVTKEGNVGIGTSAPSQMLELSKNGGTNAVKLSDTQSGASLTLQLAGAVGTLLRSGATVLSVGGSPNIGYLGGANPSFNHLFYGVVGSSPVLAVRATSGQTADLLQWQNSAGTALGVVTSGGNVGIGTTAPTEKLFVNGNSYIARANGSAGNCYALAAQEAGATGYVGFQQRGTAAPAGSAFGFILGMSEVYAYNTGGLGLGSSSGPVLVAAGGVERMRVISTGLVGIGTVQPNEKLSVSGGHIDIESGGYGLKVEGTQVVGARQSAIVDAAGGIVVDTEARDAINALLAAVRTHGLIAT